MRLRRRSIRFDGRTVTIRIAVKDGFFGANAEHRIPVGKIVRIRHSEPGTFKHGQVEFVAPGLPTDVPEVPLFADKLPANVIQYDYGDRKRVAALLDTIDKARGAK